MAILTETGYQMWLNNEIRKRMKWLVLRSMVKMLIIILILVNFVNTYALISLVLLFAFYFTMPTSYTTREPYKAIESWMRMFLGLCIASLLWSILEFGGTAAGFFTGLSIMPVLYGGGMSSPIYLLSLAFFFTLPKREEVSGGIGGLWSEGRLKDTKRGQFANYMRGTVSGDSFQSVGNIVFLLFVVMAGLFILRNWMLGESATVMFVAFWLLCLAAGWMSGREGRPYVGIMMVGLAILIFSFQFTGIVGGAVFGAYWPTVEHYGSMITEPLGEMYEQASGGISDAWLLMTNPAAYEAAKRQEQQAKASVIKKGGTKKSIELEDFSAINYGTGTPTIDPNLFLIGSIYLKNEGEFIANNVKVTLGQPLVKDPSRVGAYFNSDRDCWRDALESDDFESKAVLCSYMPLLGDTCVFSACTGADQEEFSANDVSQCTWNSESNPGDFKLMTFKCGEINEQGEFEGWSSSGEDYIYNRKTYDLSHFAIGRCDCYCNSRIPSCKNAEEETLCCDNTDELGNNVDGYRYGSCVPKTDGGWCDLNKALLTYSYAKFYVTLDMDYEFDYNVDVQAEVAIMNTTIFLEKLMNKEIKPEGKESKYTGGPVVFTIWVQDQPLRSGEQSFATVSVYNDGKGTLVDNEIDSITLKIPKQYITELDKSSETGFTVSDPDSESDDEYYIITGSLDGDLETNQYARFTFDFVGELPEDVIEKTTLFIADFDYTYSTNKKIEMPIVSAPIVG